MKDATFHSALCDEGTPFDLKTREWAIKSLALEMASQHPGTVTIYQGVWGDVFNQLFASEALLLEMRVSIPGHMVIHWPGLAAVEIAGRPKWFWIGESGLEMTEGAAPPALLARFREAVAAEREDWAKARRWSETNGRTDCDD